jgi:hypothetical protein
MFCDRCGGQLTGRESFCASCGKALNTAPPARPAAGRIEGHVRMLGVFWLAYSTLRLLGGWFFSTFFARWGGFWNPHLPFFVPGLLRGVGMMLMAGGALGIVAGWGLLERQPWARMLAIVLGFLVLFHFGLGTVLGIYTLWVLLPAESAREYQRTARPA